jgi:hypothetical protein
LPAWYLYTTDASSVRLLTDDGAPSPELSAEPARTLAELTAAIHSTACRLAEHELRHLRGLGLEAASRRPTLAVCDACRVLLAGPVTAEGDSSPSHVKGEGMGWSR